MEAIKKVIVIGLDGLEPTIVDRLLQAGALPNMAKLCAAGGYTRVRTTAAAQTPVAWSTFATGVNPGGHGIYDFVHRDPKTYFPILSLNRYEQKNPFLPPKAVNMRRGTAIWDLLTTAGIPSTVLRCPCTYPPDQIRGRMLAGVGVPDLRGGLGTSTFYSTDGNLVPGESENVLQLTAGPDGGAGGLYRTHLIGPRNPKTRDDITFELTLQVDEPRRSVLVHSAGEPAHLELREGQWSDWLKVKFKAGPLMAVRGMVRFYLTQATPTLQLHASPVNFDPESPLFPISSPPEYTKELSARLGAFYTTGMVEDHGGLNNERFDEAAYLAQCEGVLHERERMMLYELNRLKEGLLYCLFDTPDRLQHMFWRFGEPEHPANRGLSLTNAYADVIDEHYRACDRIVGQAMEFADPSTLFIVLSDHGMNSFRRGVNLNTWLYEHGFLALKKGLTPGAEAGDFLRAVDWSRTQAYALGLSSIYLNLAGREAEGIVKPGQAAQVKAQIAGGLAGLRDPRDGSVAISSVVPSEQLYSGPYLHEAPDLLVNFAAGYRASWGTPLGGVPEGLFEDNTKRWAGDHAVDPQLVPGVLLMNRPLPASGVAPGLEDLAPTILAALRVPKGPAMEGSSLLQ